MRPGSCRGRGRADRSRRAERCRARPQQDHGILDLRAQDGSRVRGSDGDRRSDDAGRSGARGGRRRVPGPGWGRGVVVVVVVGGPAPRPRWASGGPGARAPHAARPFSSASFPRRDHRAAQLKLASRTASPAHSSVLLALRRKRRPVSTRRRRHGVLSGGRLGRAAGSPAARRRRFQGLCASSCRLACPACLLRCPARGRRRGCRHRWPHHAGAAPRRAVWGRRLRPCPVAPIDARRECF